MDNKVYLVPCDNYESDNVSAAMKSIIEKSGMLDFVKSGTKVVIKANLVTHSKPEKCATTHPSLICELVKEIVRRGGNAVVGDSPGGLYNSVYVGNVYNASGMTAVRDAGGELNADYSTKTASFPKGKVLHDFEYTAYLDNCDAIINFCKLKTHGMMGMSSAVKNLFGAIPGTFKPEYHMRFPNHSAFADMLIDLNEYFKPVYNIVDAVEGMEGNGPTMGTPRHIGCILSCACPYRLDLACAEIIGLDIDKIPTIKAAIERGLSPESIKSTEIDGDIKRFSVSDFNLVEDNKDIRFSGKGNIISGIVGWAARVFFKSRPELCKEDCIGCGKCRDICPAKAIEIKDKIAVIDRKKCIRCFCCQEFCPKGAMKVKRVAAAKIINRSSK